MSGLDGERGSAEPREELAEASERLDVAQTSPFLEHTTGWFTFDKGRLTYDASPAWGANEQFAEAARRLQDARAEAQRRQPGEVKLNSSLLYALSALADVRANVDEAILILVHQLRLARPPASWEAIARVLGISKQSAHERYARQIHHDGYL